MSKRIKLKINGMHCASCEVLIERRFKNIKGVEGVQARPGEVEVYCSQEPPLLEFQNAIRNDGYGVSFWSGQELAPRKSRRDYLELGAIFLIVVAAYIFLRQFDLLPQLGLSENMSYGLVFLIGLVAAGSTCLAVTGGLLLAVSAKYNEHFADAGLIQKVKPHFYFNIGRITSYAVFGGLIGALGSVISLSPRVNGVITIFVSVLMVILGVQLLHLLPSLGRFQPKMPKFLSHKIHDLAEKNSGGASFWLGAGTFFLPCGFTQALQLYVLSRGDWLSGALTMLAFSLGTLPALVSLGAVSSLAKGRFQRYFLKFAGVVVILLGVFNINNGLALAGFNTRLLASLDQSVAQGDSNVQILGGKQIVNMKVSGLSYYPNQFKVLAGVPVEWHIDGTEAVGCAQVVTVPKLGITEYLPSNKEKVIKFTPQEVGKINFSCTMGMTTRSSYFEVVPNDSGVVASAEEEVMVADASTDGCNPEIMNCVPAQKFAMEVSRERGFHPNTFNVKRGIPVEVEMDVKVPLGGCMSVLVIPQYDVTLPLKLGKNILKFTPTEAGVAYATCSMGSTMMDFIVN